MQIDKDTMYRMFGVSSAVKLGISRSFVDLVVISQTVELETIEVTLKIEVISLSVNNNRYNRFKSNLVSFENHEEIFLVATKNIENNQCHTSQDDFIEFIVDSGASEHIVTSDKYLINISIRGVDQKIIRDEKLNLLGNIVRRIQVTCLDSKILITIEEVLYLKDLWYNLLSVACIE